MIPTFQIMTSLDLFNTCINDITIGELRDLLQTDLEITDKHVCDAIRYRDSPEMAELLLSYYTPQNIHYTLCCAVHSNFLTIAKMLLDLGADLNYVPTDIECKRLDLCIYRYYHVNHSNQNRVGYLLYYVLYNCQVDMLKLLIGYGIDLTVNDNMALTVFSEWNFGWRESDEGILQSVKEIWDILTSHHQFPQKAIDDAFIGAVSSRRFFYAKFLLDHIQSDNSQIIINDIFRCDPEKECMITEDVILFCLNHLNFQNNIKELGLIANRIAVDCNFGDTFEVVNKLIYYNYPFTPIILRQYMLSALFHKNRKLIKLLREHLDLSAFLDLVTSDIMNASKETI